MSTTSQDAMPLLCELGWHRPESLARWNDGYYFSKCTRCGRDLVRTAYGSWQLPKGYRVVWQPKPPETREAIALIPSEDVAAEGSLGDRFDFPVADVTPNPPAWIEPPETEASTPATPPVMEHAPEESKTLEEPAPPVQPREAASTPDLAAEPDPIAAEEPLPQLGDRFPVQDEAVGEPVAVVTAEPLGAQDQPEAEIPVEELLQQPNGTGHTLDQHLSIAPEPPAPPVEPAPQVEDAQPARREGGKELPISELLRHLNASPAPDPDLTLQDERGVAAAPPEAEDEPFAEGAARPLVEEAAEPGDQPPELVQQEASLPADELVEVTSADDEAHLQPSPNELSDQLDAAAEPDFAELPFEPALPPRPAPAPPADLPPGWDFMAEEEEDPIGTFWDDAAADSMPGADGRVSARGQSDPPPEQEQTGGQADIGEPGSNVTAPEQPEPSGAASATLPEPTARSVSAPRPAEPAKLIATPPPQRSEPVRSATWPRWMDGEAEAATSQPVGSSAASRQPDADVPGDRLVDAAGRTSAAYSSEAARRAPEPDDVPPWIDAKEEESVSGASGSGSSRFAVTAIVSIGVLALAAALAGRPDSSPTEVTQRQAAPAPVAAPATKPPAKDDRNAQAPTSAAPRVPFARRDPAFVSPGRPVPMALPALPAREQAFVTASVLQCRSAPVNQSPAVRKLMRGAEVQILARDGAWASVAHKGRQCWAAARFLSAAQPL